jgi:flagellar biosynthesis protein FliQ
MNLIVGGIIQKRWIYKTGGVFNSLLTLNATAPCTFSVDTLAMSTLTISTVGFFLLFSVATFIATREDKMEVKLEKKIPKRIEEDTSLNLSLWFLDILVDPKVIEKFIISSLLYLVALLLCLINYFVQSYMLLYINLVIVLLITGFLISVIEAVPQLILSTKKSLLFVFKALFVFHFLAFLDYWTASYIKKKHHKYIGGVFQR